MCPVLYEVLYINYFNVLPLNSDGIGSPDGIGSLIIPILQIQQVRFREVKESTEDHIVSGRAAI